MSLFSKSRSKGHYPKHNHGSGYYKRSHGSKGIFGKLFEALTGSRSHSDSHSDHHGKHYSNDKHDHYKDRHHHKSSWS